MRHATRPGPWRPHIPCIPCTGHAELHAESSMPSPPGWPGPVRVFSGSIQYTLLPNLLTLTATSRMPQILETALYRDIVRRRRCACVFLCMATPTWLAALHSAPTPHPLVTERHFSRQALGPCWNDGQHCSSCTSAPFLQLCTSAAPKMDLCVRHSGHLTSSSTRPVRPKNTHKSYRFYLFLGPTLLQYLGQRPR